VDDLGQRVLVVDDDHGICMLLEKWLTAAGYDVALAADGDKAIEALRRRHFDLMLTDIIMPGREGIETLLEVREHWPRIKIMAMSGGGRVDAEEFLSLAGHLGADATVRKPFRREPLLDLVAATLEASA